MLKKWMITGSALFLLTACGTATTNESMDTPTQPSRNEANTMNNETKNTEPVKNTNTTIEEQSIVEEPNTTTTPTRNTNNEKAVEDHTAHKENITNSTTNNAKSNQSNTVDITNPAVSLTEAVKIFNEAYPNAKIESVDLDVDFGRLNYDIDGFDSTKEYEVEIDVITKELRVNKIENDKEYKQALDFSSIIAPSKAIEIASKQSEVNGLSPIGWTLEAEHGLQIYTIEYRKDRYEIEIAINATSGEVLEVEMDD